MKRRKLVVISHTEHYKDQDGNIKGWGPTIKEIDYLADYWEEVVHVGCLHAGDIPPSSFAYTKPNIRFVPIPPYGGKTISDKIGILFKIPKIILQVVKSQKDASEVQLRVPTSMALFLLPLFSFILPRKYTFWVKYAGNWSQKKPPLSYRMQRYWLKKNFAKCAVTINGFWPDQPKHCHSFENPSLTGEDIIKGIKIAEEKDFVGPYTFSFIGRLEDPKGVTRIIDALKIIPSEKINKIHFVGDGRKTDEYRKQAAFLGDKVIFHGFLGKEKIHEILASSHFFLLPSTASEGFPKVISEAACYGAIPIVSDVSSISHYINDSNGFLWKIEDSISFDQVFLNAINTDPKKLKVKSNNVLSVAKLFTFENYWNKLKKYVFFN